MFLLFSFQVSAFSTWEKELHKIVFDPRYLLLVAKERKQVFEQFVKCRVEEERKEKGIKLKQRKEHFRQLLVEARLHGRYGIYLFKQQKLLSVLVWCSQNFFKDEKTLNHVGKYRAHYESFVHISSFNT